MADNERKITVQSPLGENALLFRHMSGQEALGRLFELKVDLLSEQSTIDAGELLGKTMTVCMDLPGGGQRFFNGIVAVFGQAGTQGRYTAYHAVLRPKAWLLSLRSNCRVFQDKKASQIIQQVLKDAGVDIKDSLSGSYSEREYCVQYRETDLAFVARLMEEEGIYYYFTHAKDKHTLVLADSINAHKSVKDYDTVPYFPPDEGAARERDHLDRWSQDQAVQSHSVTFESYSFEEPGKDLLVKATSKAAGYKDTSLVRFDFPDDYVDPSVGQHRAQVCQEHIDSTRARASGGGNAAGLFAGCLFSVTDHPQTDLNHEYLPVAASYILKANDYESGAGGGAEPFRIDLQAIDSQTPFRLAQATIRPEVPGLQSAVVIGGGSGGAWTDQYGRVRVQFFWDRQGQRGAGQSCWLRVAQSWAGPGWGAQFIPRVGHEVLVAFLGGDPDHPIVVGSVYNADNMPPYTLPDNASQSGIRTHSVDGGAANFNELRFEDKAGSEQVYIQAEKDFVQLVKNGDQTTTLQKGNQDVTLSKGNRTVTLDAGNLTTTVSKGKAVIEAKQSIELKVGQSSVVIKPDGITLKGPKLELNGDTAVKLKGAIAQINGSGAVKIKGGLVNIN